MKSSFIKIGARNYSIAILDDDAFNVALSKRTNDCDDAKSFVDYDDQIILVRGNLSYEHKKELIVHELLHACLEDSGSMHGEIEEKMISALAPRLNEFFDRKFFKKISQLCD